MKLKEAEQLERHLPDEWIIMVHPELEDSYREVPVPAFEEVWKDLGWERSDLLDETGYSRADLEEEAKADKEAEEAMAATASGGRNRPEATSVPPEKEQ